MKKTYTAIAFLFFTTISFGQVEFNLSQEEKGGVMSMQPFGSGYVVERYGTIYNDKSKGFYLAYFDEDGNAQWQKKIDRKVWDVSFLVGDNFVYDIVYPLYEVPFQVSIINEKGEIKSSEDKLSDLFTNEFDNFTEVMNVSGDYSFLINDDLYIVFSNKVKDMLDYYLVRIDQDFNVESHKLGLSCNWKDVFYKKGASPKLVEIKEDKIYFSQAYKTEESYSFSLFEVNLITFDEEKIIDNVALKKNTIGDKGFLTETHPGAFHPEGTNYNSAVDYQSNVVRGQTWGKTSGQSGVFSPSIDARYSCKRIGDKWYFFGIHYDIKPFTTEPGSGKEIIGTWTMMVDPKGETTISASNCFASLDRKNFGNIECLNLYMTEDKELCFLSKCYNTEMYLSHPDRSDIKPVSEGFIEGNINPMVALAMVDDIASGDLKIARKNAKVYVFREVVNTDRKSKDIKWKLKVY